MYIQEIALNPIPLDGRMALAVICYPTSSARYTDDGDPCDGNILLLDSQDGSEIRSQEEIHWGSYSICTVTVGGSTLLACGCVDGEIQLRDPTIGNLIETLQGHQNPVTAICQVGADDSSLLASASSDGEIRIWNLASGERIRAIQSNIHWPESLCVIGSSPDCVIASTYDRKIFLWNPFSGILTKTLERSPGSINALCSVNFNNSHLIASGENPIEQVLIGRGEVDEGSRNCAVRLWDPVSGGQVGVFEGHSDAVMAVCSFSIHNRRLLASAGNDAVVRIWDMTSKTCILTIPVYYSVTSMTSAGDSLFIGLDNGVLAIKLEEGLISS